MAKTSWERFLEMRKNYEPSKEIEFDEESDLMDYDESESDYIYDYDLEGVMQ